LVAGIIFFDHLNRGNFDVLLRARVIEKYTLHADLVMAIKRRELLRDTGIGRDQRHFDVIKKVSGISVREDIHALIGDGTVNPAFAPGSVELFFDVFQIDRIGRGAARSEKNSKQADEDKSLHLIGLSLGWRMV
jgi:hypothetical protein